MEADAAREAFVFESVDQLRDGVEAKARELVGRALLTAFVGKDMARPGLTELAPVLVAQMKDQLGDLFPPGQFPEGPDRTLGVLVVLVAQSKEEG